VRFRRTKPTPSQLAERLERCDRCGASAGIYERSCPSCGSSLVDEKKALLRDLRDRDVMTGDAFDVAVRILESGAGPEVAEPAPHARKRIGDIRASDLRESPVWEFALDEEGLDGQDEETVRPRPEVDRVDPRDGVFVVLAEFRAADGTRFDGFVSPHEEQTVGYVQPTIVADETHVRFWFGIVAPKPHVLAAGYRALDKSASELFPLRYCSLVETTDGDVAGTIDGFMHYAAGSTDEIVSIR
jgi:hypothetical protein